MTRPKDLPALLQAYALGNYAAGPSWGGTPQRAAPGLGYLVPGVTLPAENENYLHGSAFDAAQGAINAVGQLPALNWSPQTTQAYNIGTAVYSEAEQAWYVPVNAATTTIYKTYDFGRSWLTAATAVSAACNDIAFDTAGNAVITPAGGTNVQEGPLVSYGTNIVFTNHAAVFPVSTGGTSLSSVVFDPSSSTWCILTAVTGGPAAFTSTDRATWTQRTVFASNPGSQAQSQLGVGGGVLVAAMANAATGIRVARSANGGVSWTNEQVLTVNASITLPLSTTEIVCSKPVWSATDGLWYLSAYQFSPRKTQIWSSPDAINWTTVATILANDVAITQMACLGALIVGLSGNNVQTGSNTDGRLYVSVNKGANWLKAGRGTDSFAQFLRSGGGGLALAGTSKGVGFSSRFGLPTVVAF